MAAPRDYYEVLGIDRSATPDQIRRAHRRLARQFHPDMNKDAAAAARFAEVQAAYDTLSDEQRRSEYDRFGHAGPTGFHAGVRAGGPAGGSSGGPSGAGSWRVDVDPADFASTFEELFGRAADRGHGGSSPGGGGGSGVGGGRAWGADPFGRPFAGAKESSRRRGTDLEQVLDIDFMTAALGGTRIVHVHGAPHESARLDVRVPPGVEPGATLRLAGRGRPGRGGAPAGDVRLTVKIAPHPWFRRDGNDVLLDLPISIAEAALGCTVTVPLLRGTVDLKVPAGTSGGKRLRVRGQGIVGRAGATGDFYAVITVVAPKELAPDDLAALRDIGTRLPDPRAAAPWASSLEDAG